MGADRVVRPYKTVRSTAISFIQIDSDIIRAVLLEFS
mgnify:FL=1